MLYIIDSNYVIIIILIFDLLMAQNHNTRIIT